VPEIVVESVVLALLLPRVVAVELVVEAVQVVVIVVVVVTSPAFEIVVRYFSRTLAYSPRGQCFKTFYGRNLIIYIYILVTLGFSSDGRRLKLSTE
jgi:hypothetical protein